jgi:hypothetical protein
LGQAMVALMFLINMELAFWEACVLLVLFLIPLAFPAASGGIAIAYYVWAGVEFVRILAGRRRPAALTSFAEVWRTQIRPKPDGPRSAAR